MSEETKTLIEELKEVMMDLYRSAGNLDEIIRSVEGTIETYSNDESYISCLVKSQARYRMEYKHQTEFDKLDEKEKEIWQKLINSVKTEES